MRHLVCVALGIVITAEFSFGRIIDIPTSYGGGADAYVEIAGTSPNFTYPTHGIDTSLNFNHTANRASYIRFDLSKLGRAKVLDARLYATVMTEVAGYPVQTIYGLNDGLQAGSVVNGWAKYGETWPENKICWTNAPAAGTNNLSFIVGTETGQVSKIGLARYVSFDSSGTKLVAVDDTYVVASGTNLVNFLDADTDGLVTFIVVQGSSGTSNRTQWKTKEHPDNKPPFLRIVTQDTRIVNIPISRGVGADAQISELTATNVNYGAAGYSVVGKVGDSLSMNGKTYLRFDLRNLVRPIRYAKLNMTVVGGKNNMSVEWMGLNNGSQAGGGYLGENWSESSITWNNAPGVNVLANGVTFGTSTTNGGAFVSLCLRGINRQTQSDLDYVAIGDTFTAIENDKLVDFLNADTNDMVTLACRYILDGLSGGQTYMQFATKENATYPAPVLSLVDSRVAAMLIIF